MPSEARVTGVEIDTSTGVRTARPTGAAQRHRQDIAAIEDGGGVTGRLALFEPRFAAAGD